MITPDKVISLYVSMFMKILLDNFMSQDPSNDRRIDFWLMISVHHVGPPIIHLLSSSSTILGWIIESIILMIFLLHTVNNQIFYTKYTSTWSGQTFNWSWLIMIMIE